MGLPSVQALVGWGEALLLSHIFQGGLENYLGRGLTPGVWEGILFFVSQVVFFGFFGYRIDELQFQVASMPYNAVQCCGVLWSR